MNHCVDDDEMVNSQELAQQKLCNILDHTLDYLDTPCVELQEPNTDSLRLLPGSVAAVEAPTGSGAFVNLPPPSKRRRKSKASSENPSISEIAALAVNASTIFANAAPLQRIAIQQKVPISQENTVQPQDKAILTAAKIAKRKKRTTAEKDAEQARRIAALVANQTSK